MTDGASSDLARKVVEHFSMAGLAFGGETKELKEGLGREEAGEGGRASDFLRSIATRAFLLSCCGACASCASEEFSYAFLAAAAVGGDSLEEARP